MRGEQAQEVKTSCFVYPDVADRITERVIESFGEEAWRIEEEYVLYEAMRCINNDKIRVRFILDAGCGTGRLFYIIRRIKNDEMFGVDIDPSRLAKASAMAHKLGNTIHLICADLSKIALNIKCDVIICSHVLQHVSRRCAIEILKNFKRLLNRRGLLVLMVSKSSSNEYYLMVKKRGRNVISQKIDAKTFDSLCLKNKPGLLMVRKFDILKLRQDLERLGFKVLKVYSYHVKIPFRHPILHWITVRIVNLIPFLKRKLGIDALIICRRR